MNSAILDDITRSLPDLSKSERKVAEWLLANARRAIDATINDVAFGADVSEPTVIRLCRSMGLAGFRELKTHLIAALQFTWCNKPWATEASPRLVPICTHGRAIQAAGT